ncbi:MAG: FKBP-type peptidyl-prolyl cis-trans isomerase [Verrucomicrobium sp.]|nr:FKBP-type peptidyl-prolyl cis-trans isomerase [Verrucomicrobium sp.]
MGERRDFDRKVKYTFLAFLLAFPLSLRAAEPSVLARPPLSDTGLIREDILAGDGSEVSDGKLVEATYIGRYPDGKSFDRAHAKEPFRFVQGVSRLLPGWTLGIAGMREGGRRIVTVPPILAYGKDGVEGLIPPESTLVYEIRILSVK